MPTGKPGHVDLWSLLDASWTAEEGGLAAYLHRVLDTSAATFKASGASLFLLDAGSHAYRLAAKSGSDSRVPDDAVIVPGQGIAGQAVLRRKPMLLNDPSDTPDLRNVERRTDLVSSMVVPLATDESGCVGVLNLSRKQGLQAFSDEDLTDAETVARRLSLALSNALLFQRMDEAVKDARTAQIRLRAVLESLGVGIMILDREGTVVQRNLQFPSGVEAGQAWSACLDDLPEPLIAAVGSVVDTAKRGIKDLVLVSDEKYDRTWSVVGGPMRVGLLVAIEETTELSRLQREAERTNRLAEIGQMTAAIAHEIRNPLASIISTAQFLRESPDQVPYLTRIIEEEALKLNELCSGFLAFAKPISLDLDDVKLADVARHVVQRQQPAFEQAGVELTLDIRDDSVVTGDRRRLEQACLNLTLNALQACESGDRVSITVEHGILSVRDSGHGMDEAARSRLFTPFFTTKASGTGLGLSNVMKIVDAHGGKIDVSTLPGEGSTFTLDFKAAA